MGLGLEEASEAPRVQSIRRHLDNPETECLCKSYTPGIPFASLLTMKYEEFERNDKWRAGQEK
jgi:hypothetical protein